MIKIIGSIVLLFMCSILVLGCDAAFVTGGRAIGIRSGHFIYSEGNLRADYNFPIDKVWTACEMTLSQIKAVDINQSRKIAYGKITAVAQEEKILITIDYVSKDLTSVSILVGMAGNNIASHLIHEKIGNNLQKLASSDSSSVPSQQDQPAGQEK